MREENAQGTASRVTAPLPAWFPSYCEALDNLMEKNTMTRTKADGTSAYLSAFHTLTDPRIPIRFYVERLWRYSGCVPAAAFGALVFIDRLTSMNDMFAPSRYNIHRVLTVSLVLSMKFYQEEVYPNDYLGSVGGMVSGELNLLELDVLSRMSYNAFIGEAELQRAIDAVEGHAAAASGARPSLPSARYLLESLWDSEEEAAEPEEPSTPPAPTPAPPAAAAGGHFGQLVSEEVYVPQRGQGMFQRRFSDSVLDSQLGGHGHGHVSHGQPAAVHASASTGCLSMGAEHVRGHVHGSAAGLVSLAEDEAMCFAYSANQDSFLSEQDMYSFADHSQQGMAMETGAGGGLLCDECFDDGSAAGIWA